MSSQEPPKPSIWQLQEALRQWHDREYVQAYPNSEFITGKTLAARGKKPWDELTPEEQERKERAAYHLNQLLFSMGVNVSGSFRDESQ
jgi:hypothetical protein